MTRRHIATLALAGALAAGGGGVAYTKQQQAVKTVSTIQTAVVRRTIFTQHPNAPFVRTWVYW